MINIIVCDDNKNDLNKIRKSINKIMKSLKIDYKENVFMDYDESFMKIIDKKMPFKFYILDIETPSRSGIDIARIIRRKDYTSPIIFLTGHNDLGVEVLSEDIIFTSFINKFVNYEQRLKKSIINSINSMNKKRILRLRDGNTLYTINLNDILYLTKESLSRKTVIVTDYNEFYISQSLNSVKDLLDDDFIQTHRACIVNKNRVCKIDFKNKIICFDNNVEIEYEGVIKVGYVTGDIKTEVNNVTNTITVKMSSPEVFDNYIILDNLKIKEENNILNPLHVSDLPTYFGSIKSDELARAEQEYNIYAEAEKKAKEVISEKLSVFKDYKVSFE